MVNDISSIILNSVKNSSNTTKSFYDNMSTYQKNLFDDLIGSPEKFNDFSLNDLIFEFDKNFVQYILNLELEYYLMDCKEKGIYNKKNGSTKDISLSLKDRTILFNRPRLRYEKNFNSALLPKRTRVLEDLSDNIMLLFSKNNSVNDIHEILKAMFHTDVSIAYISHVINKISDDIITWRNRELQSCYFTCNIDCTYITLRDEKHLESHKIPIYVAVGTTLDGLKEIVGIYLGNEDENGFVIDKLYNQDIAESKSFWLTVFNDLKDRGVKKVLYFVSDGLPGIVEAINDEFPCSIYQRCIVHLDRNLYKYIDKKNKAEVMRDFKSIYNAQDKNLAILNRDAFLEKYSDKKTLIKHASEYFDYIMPLFDLPINIRKYIYTNNIVESVNSKIKRGFYGRGALPNVQSAINIIYCNLIDLEKKWASKKVTNWDNIYNEIISLHFEDIKEYL